MPRAILGFALIVGAITMIGIAISHTHHRSADQKILIEKSKQ